MLLAEGVPTAILWFSFYKISKPRSWGHESLSKCLLYKDKDMNLFPSTHEKEIGRFLDLLFSQYSQLVKDPSSKTKVESNGQRHFILTCNLYALGKVCASAQTCRQCTHTISKVVLADLSMNPFICSSHHSFIDQISSLCPLPLSIHLFICTYRWVVQPMMLGFSEPRLLH